MLRPFLALYLGHLLADFLFQTDRLVQQKRRGSVAAYAVHGLIHYGSCALVLGFFVPRSILSAQTQLILIGLASAHLLIDFAKVQIAIRYKIKNGTRAYLVDQFVHLLTVTAAALLIAPSGSFAALTAAIDRGRAARNAVLLVPVVYVAVIFGGGYLVRFLTRSLAEVAGSSSREISAESLRNAGLYIGWLERFLVVTALLLQSPAMIGLIFTAKSIVRYPEFKSERFAEYFLIGTLLSLSIAIVGGAILARLLSRSAPASA